jgi:outer membrane protein
LHAVDTDVAVELSSGLAVAIGRLNRRHHDLVHPSLKGCIHVLASYARSFAWATAPESTRRWAALHFPDISAALREAEVQPIPRLRSRRTAQRNSSPNVSQKGPNMPERNPSRLSLESCHRTVILAAIFVAWTPSAFAQDSLPGDGSGQWALGLGAVVVDKPYRDFDREVLPLPLVSYESKWISATVPTFDVKLYSSESLSFRLRARWSGDGYEAKDSPVLSGMDERKSSLWAGGAVTWKTDFANLSGEVLTDAMGNSKGMRAKLQIDRRFAAGKFGFTPRLAAEWVDDKYVDYYYGVQRSEARVGRPFHEGKATANMQLGLRMDYSPSRNHTWFVDVGATRFGGSIKDSPLVGKATGTTLALGYAYRF